jgi:exonuclease VII small subunit
MAMRMMCNGRRYLVVASLLFVLALNDTNGSLCEALLSQEWQQVSISRLRLRTGCFNQNKLYGMLPRSNSNSNNEKEDEDEAKAKALQKERLRLEALIVGTTSDVVKKNKQSSSKDDYSLLPVEDWKDHLLLNPPPLTAIGKERFEMEIQLLKSLVDSDDAVPELWTLWYHSRGPNAARALEVTDSLTAQGPEFWNEAEQKLQQLVAEEGVAFVEAVNRLATLHFLQGRYPESKQLCEVVLAVKPWHLGALSGIVVVCKGLKDTPGMMAWASQRMPPLQVKGDENNRLAEKQILQMPTRKEWVDGMVAQAQTRLEQAEQGVKDSFQELRDEPPIAWLKMEQQQDYDDDAWQ